MKYLIVIAFLLIGNAFALTDGEAIKKCLQNFDNHPFDKVNPKYRVLESSVKIVGLGADVNDHEKPKEVDLVLVKSAVSIISKTTYNLLSPNSWYCLGGNVSIISKTVINLACAARLTSARDSIVIIGKESNDVKGGVTIIGKTSVNLVGCPK